jgi:hypothetical protein
MHSDHHNHHAKRTVTVALGLILALGVIGCGSSPTDGSADSRVLATGVARLQPGGPAYTWDLGYPPGKGRIVVRATWTTGGKLAAYIKADGPRNAGWEQTTSPVVCVTDDLEPDLRVLLGLGLDEGAAGETDVSYTVAFESAVVDHRRSTRIRP